MLDRATVAVLASLVLHGLHVAPYHRTTLVVVVLGFSAFDTGPSHRGKVAAAAATVHPFAVVVHAMVEQLQPISVASSAEAAECLAEVVLPY